MKKTAIIVAGGSGSRMQSEIPKQFLKLEGKAILVHTIKAFLQAFEDISIIVVLPDVYMEEGKSLISNAYVNKDIIYAEGGQTRFDSVKSGLSKVKDSGIIFVHDAVRCLVTPQLIQRCFYEAMQKGSAIPVIPVKDSIRIVEDNGSSAVNRELLRAVQTPQTFQSEIIIPAFNQTYKDSFTDEATVAESFGCQVHLVDGEEANIKITVPSDLDIAREIIKKRND